MLSAKELLTIIAVLYSVSASLAEDLTLTILHTNDVHSRFLEANKHGGPCPEAKEAAKQCYGGFPRLHYKVKEIRSVNPNVMYLSGGDYFQGTVWYNLYKHNVVSKYVNILNHTAMALGNHEFDDAIDGLVPFLDKATFPILSCNIDAAQEPKVQGKIKKSVVVVYEGVKVGIIGYTTTETPDVSYPGKLDFQDEVDSIKAETERLRAEGVNILIALGHSGYEVDKKIAKKVPLIDVVVGGHSHTFLYHGKHPDVEEPMGDYPTVVKQPTGRSVPVVQAYAHGKYLGYLNVTFNEAGEAIGWTGNPILLDGSVPQDELLLEELKTLQVNLTKNIRETIGKTQVFLNGSRAECRLRECNLGNLITDAMVWINLRGPEETRWSDVTMAIMHGGGVRASIDEKSKNGNVSIEDILSVQPFQHTIDIIEIQGKHLLAAFEFAVEGYDAESRDLPGKFLQVSGIRVVYDVRKPEGTRVKSLQVLCSECRVPQYEPIDTERIYKVSIPNFLATGGDGYKVIKNNIIKRHENGILDSDMLQKYIIAKSPITAGKEGRIQFHSFNNDSNNSTNSSRTSGTNNNALSSGSVPVVALTLSLTVMEVWLACYF